MSNSIKQEMMELKNWAIVGATGKKDRYGYKIWKLMQEEGYNIFGVSPNYSEIEGKRIYHSIKDIGEKIDVIDMVVSPKIAIEVLEQAKDLGITRIFFQPGSYNTEVIAKAEELGLKYLTDDCVYATLKNSSH